MNGSLISVARTRAKFTQRLLMLGLGLTVLFTATSPQITGSLSLASRFGFWSLHIGIGLATATWSAHALIKYTTLPRDWRLIVLAGLGGVALFAPFAVFFEVLFPSTDQGADSDWADQWARTSMFAAIAIEGFELAPSYLAAWMLINIESFNRTLKDWSRSDSGRTTTQPMSEATVDIARWGASNSSPPLVSDSKDPHRNQEFDEFLSRLPAAIGTRVVCVSSDLHYLDVVTRKGKASILGSLAEVEELFGERGLRVHRSHWVHLDQVVQLRKASSGWLLDMSDGSVVPVSRRKRRCVTESLGANFTRLAVAS